MIEKRAAGCFRVARLGLFRVVGLGVFRVDGFGFCSGFPRLNPFDPRRSAYQVPCMPASFSHFPFPFPFASLTLLLCTCFLFARLRSLLRRLPRAWSLLFCLGFFRRLRGCGLGFLFCTCLLRLACCTCLRLSCFCLALPHPLTPCPLRSSSSTSRQGPVLYVDGFFGFGLRVADLGGWLAVVSRLGSFLPRRSGSWSLPSPRWLGPALGLPACFSCLLACAWFVLGALCRRRFLPCRSSAAAAGGCNIRWQWSG